MSADFIFSRFHTRIEMCREYNSGSNNWVKFKLSCVRWTTRARQRTGLESQLLDFRAVLWKRFCRDAPPVPCPTPTARSTPIKDNSHAATNSVSRFPPIIGPIIFNCRSILEFVAFLRRFWFLDGSALKGHLPSEWRCKENSLGSDSKKGWRLRASQTGNIPI